jgi:hypothetical protein
LFVEDTEGFVFETDASETKGASITKYTIKHIARCIEIYTTI